MLLERFTRTLLGLHKPPTIEPLVLPALALAASQGKKHPSLASAIQTSRDDNLRDDWTDTARPMKPREKPVHFRPLLPVISVEKAADHLITWANDAGVTGLFTSVEIDDLWRRANVELGVAEIRPMFVREALAERNLCLGKRRTLTPEYAAVYQRTGVKRAVLYRLPLVSAQVGQEPDRVPAAPDLAPGSVRSNGGPGTGLAQKTNGSRKIGYADAA